MRAEPGYLASLIRTWQDSRAWPMPPRPGIVYDPFSGRGTTGAVAVRVGRQFVGTDVRQSQVELTELPLPLADIARLHVSSRPFRDCRRAPIESDSSRSRDSAVRQSLAEFDQPRIRDLGVAEPKSFPARQPLQIGQPSVRDLGAGKSEGRLASNCGSPCTWIYRLLCRRLARASRPAWHGRQPTG